MEESKIISTLQKFYKVIESDDPTPEEKETVRYFQFQLAQSIIEDFNDNAVIIAKLILDYFE